MKTIVYLADTSDGLHKYLDIFTHAHRTEIALHVTRSAIEAISLIETYDPDLLIASCNGDELEALALFRQARTQGTPSTLLASHRYRASDLISEIGSGVITVFLSLPCPYEALRQALERIAIQQMGHTRAPKWNLRTEYPVKRLSANTNNYR